MLRAAVARLEICLGFRSAYLSSLDVESICNASRVVWLRRVEGNAILEHGDVEAEGNDIRASDNDAEDMSLACGSE